MQKSSENERFLDEGKLIHEFSDEFLVVCPKCAEMAKIISMNSASNKLNYQIFAPRKLICLSCVYQNTWNGNKIFAGSNVDWYFRLPLWLQISCCNEILWAYNLQHLETIEQYVCAKLRERPKNGRNSFLSKLPTWMKLAKNRVEILKAISKLRTKLP
jgi:hypothetical protein